MVPRLMAAPLHQGPNAFFSCSHSIREKARILFGDGKMRFGVIPLCAGMGGGGRGNKKQEEFTLDFNICQYLTADISAAEANQRLESAKQPYQVLPTNITSECA
jgi:hypothetical protein